MEASYWNDKWHNNEIGFHQPATNPLLAKHLAGLKLKVGETVFVPLCGKTLDMVYLAAQGYKVIGVELSELAAKEFYVENNLTPSIRTRGTLTEYSAENVTIFVGDFFDLSREVLGKIDAIYDRAALIALPEDIRARYRHHMIAICESAKQLLLCFEYNQKEMAGPPFSISDRDVRAYYADTYDVSLVDRVPFGEKLKGQVLAEELAWVLST